jgi:hypothetical protein
VYLTNYDPFFNGSGSGELNEGTYKLGVTEDYGLSWSFIDITLNRKYADSTWTITPNSLPACFNAITPVYDKRRKGYVYCATRYSPDGTKVYVDTYDSFSPTAELIGTQRVPASIVPSVEVGQYATFFDPKAPLLPGHPGELGDINEPEEA